jgi:hypothetical protein
MTGRIVVVAICFLAPGLALVEAWRVLWRTTAGSPWGRRSGVNLAKAIVLTLGYSYFVIAVILLLTPSSEAFTHPWLGRNAVLFADLDLVLGLAGSAVAFGGRGPARTQIISAGLLISFLSLVMLYGMAAD